jgi:integrase
MVKVEARNGRLAYRISMGGEQWREATALRDTAKNREKLERKCQAMNDLMGEGRFDYLVWFPDGNRAERFRPVSPETRTVQTVEDYARKTWVPRNQPPHVRLTLVRTRAKHLKHILPVFGARPLDEITEADLEDFKTLLTRPRDLGGKGLALKTCRDIIDSTFRALYRDARRVDYRKAFGEARPVMVDPFAAVAWKREAGSEPDPFTAEERDLLLEYFWQRSPRWHAFVYMLFWTGLRIGEAVGLRWGDIDLRRGTFTVRRSRTLSEDNAPKTANAARTKSMRPENKAVLGAIQPLRATETDFVFTTETGSPVNAERFVDKHWRRALRVTGIRPRRLYCARATFISIAVSTSGITPKWVAEYTGTSLEMIERHYGKYMNGDESQLALLGTPTAATTGTNVA